MRAGEALPEPSLHQPYEAGPFRMAMGLSTVPPAEWLPPDRLYHDEVAQRRRLLAERPHEVLLALPGSEAAQAELLRAVAANLAEHHPRHFVRQADGLANLLTGETLRTEDVPSPLAVLGGLVQEDFCLLRIEDGTPVLVAGVLCFPNRWRLADKIGQPLAGVHVPVPIYAERLQRPVDRFLSLLRPGRIARRRNWSIVDDPTLYQPGGHDRADPSGLMVEEAGERLFLRVESQSLTRLPESGDVVFAIRTSVAPLSAVTAAPGEAARLKEAVLALPEEMARYKSLLPFRGALLAYLGRVADEG